MKLTILKLEQIFSCLEEIYNKKIQCLNVKEVSRYLVFYLYVYVLYIIYVLYYTIYVLYYTILDYKEPGEDNGASSGIVLGPQRRSFGTGCHAPKRNDSPIESNNDPTSPNDHNFERFIYNM